MATYNGFTDQQRNVAAAWEKRERYSGRKQAPVVCQVCGQLEGRIEPHSEDYSFPYGAHIGQYGFCFRCHRILHMRFRAPEAWLRYLEALRDGATFAPVHTNDNGAITAQLRGRHVDYSTGPPRPLLFFDRMELSDAAVVAPPYLQPKLALPPAERIKVPPMDFSLVEPAALIGSRQRPGGLYPARASPGDAPPAEIPARGPPRRGQLKLF
jgi:hypothetical protein